MVSFRSGSVRGLRTRSLSLTSRSKSDRRGRSRSPRRTDEQCSAPPEPMLRTPSPSPERWLHAQCVTPCAHACLAATSGVSEQCPLFSGYSGYATSHMQATMSQTVATSMQSFGVHCWQQQQVWAQPQFVFVTPAVPLATALEQAPLQSIGANFNLRFGLLADLVRDQSNATILEEILAELQRSSPADRQELILWLAPFAVQLSLTKSGTRLVQKALELSSGSCWKELMRWLVPQALELSRSRHGNFALQTLIVRMNSTEVAGLIEVLRGNVLEVAQHAYGCRSIERLIEHFSDPHVTPILDDLVTNARELAAHKNANYAISAVIEHGRPERRQQVLSALVPDATILAMNRVSTHVMMKALMCGEELQSCCVDSWLGSTSPSIAEMACSKFGSYLLADFAAIGSKANCERLRVAMAPSLSYLQATDEGGRVLAAYGF